MTNSAKEARQRRPGIDAATVGAARGLLRDDLGRIAPGTQADLVVVDLGRPATAPALDPVRNFIYYASASDVRHVLVGGKVVVEDGRVLTLDEQSIRGRAQAACERIWSAVLPGQDVANA